VKKLFFKATMTLTVTLLKSENNPHWTGQVDQIWSLNV